MNFITFLIVGLLAEWILVKRQGSGVLFNMVIGIFGAFVATIIKQVNNHQ